MIGLRGGDMVEVVIAAVIVVGVAAVILSRRENYWHL